MKFSKLFLMSAAVVLFAAVACNKETDDSGNGGDTGSTDGGETATPEIVVDADEVSVSYEGGEVTVGYSVTNAVEGESLSADVDADWVSVVVGDETITLTVGANESEESRSATVTLSYPEASDVVISVVQGIWTATYDDFLGEWNMTDAKGQYAPLTISEKDRTAGEYTVSDWQFWGLYNTLGDLNFATNTDTSLDFTAYYNSETHELEFRTYFIAEAEYYYSGIGTLTGYFKVLAGITSTYNYGTTPVADEEDYLIATLSLSSTDSGEITAAQPTFSDGSTYDFLTMEYCLQITSPEEYSDAFLIWDNSGTWFPCTLTKSSSAASTSSVKSSKKAVSVLSETKSL